MERLTERTYTGGVHLKGTIANYSRISYECQVPEGLELLKKALEKLAEYEDAEENDLLVRLPCRAGTPVYTVYKKNQNEIEYAIDCFDFDIDYIDEIGKTVFLTQEEAEAKLKDKEGENADSD